MRRWRSVARIALPESPPRTWCACCAWQGRRLRAVQRRRPRLRRAHRRGGQTRRRRRRSSRIARSRQRIAAAHRRWCRASRAARRWTWILQKATELGVAAIVPVSSERSEVKLDARARRQAPRALAQRDRLGLRTERARARSRSCRRRRRSRCGVGGVAGRMRCASCSIPTRRADDRHDRAARRAYVSSSRSARKAAGRRATARRCAMPASPDCASAHASCAPKPPASPRSRHCSRASAISRRGTSVARQLRRMSSWHNRKHPAESAARVPPLLAPALLTPPTPRRSSLRCGRGPAPARHRR